MAALAGSPRHRRLDSAGPVVEVDKRGLDAADEPPGAGQQSTLKGAALLGCRGDIAGLELTSGALEVGRERAALTALNVGNGDDPEFDVETDADRKTCLTLGPHANTLGGYRRGDQHVVRHRARA